MLAIVSVKDKIAQISTIIIENGGRARQIFMSIISQQSDDGKFTVFFIDGKEFCKPEHKVHL